LPFDRLRAGRTDGAAAHAPCPRRRDCVEDLKVLQADEGYGACQPFNVYWAKQELLVHTEFRDGNVPAGYDLLRVLKETLGTLPEGIEKVRLRADGAAYSHEFILYFCLEIPPKLGILIPPIGA
jgi:hypothetical protein